MKNSFEWLEMDDNFEIYVRKWEDETVSPQAIVQLSHGMAEHIERYHDFAKFLVDKGIFVIGNDHRGHGKTGEKAGVFGYFADKNGFERATDDLFVVTKYIRNTYKDVPIILMGHSMGSFLVRRFIQKYPNEVQAVILSGTGGNPGIAGRVGKLIAKREMSKYGKNTPSPLMDRIIFGSYNKGFGDIKNKFEWLSRDDEQVEKYIKDPMCGFVCTSGFFYDLLTGLQIIHKQEEIQKIRKDIPIFIFSGEKDPVGGHSTGVKKIINQYFKNGINRIEYKFYKNGRHEMLNEINKEEVYEDIYQWINNILNNK